MPSENEFIQQIWADFQALVQANSDSKFWYTYLIEKTQAAYSSKLKQITSEYETALKKSQSAYEQELSKENENKDINKRSALLTAGWRDPIWRSWIPAVGNNVPVFARVGQFTERGKYQSLALPALVPFIGGRPLIFKASGNAKNQSVQAIQSLLLRLLAHIPPGKLRFVFTDPIGLGQNIAPFMHLSDYDESFVTGKAWTEPSHIEQRLTDLTEHMENVIQKYLRNQFASIEEYNVQAGEVAEPYRILVALDFPSSFTEISARRLLSVAQNGPRCGVYAVIMNDTALPAPYGFNIADLDRVSTVIDWDGKRFVWQDEIFKDSNLELDAPPSPETFDQIVKTVGLASKEASRVEVPFEKLLDRAGLISKTWWQSSASKGIQIPLGPSGARKIQYLNLGDGTAQHVLVAGKTGSGKSTLLHTLITSLCLSYSPDEVELYLIDFKKGVEFKPYATRKLPHARVVAIESEREFGLSVLQGLDAELKERGDLFHGAGVDHISDYREKSDQLLPRILLLVDEFQEFFTEDDIVASQASQILDRLVRQGRAFGLHVLLGSQTLAGAYSLARSTIDQMAVRIALQCSEADSRLILADDNPAARLLSRPGEAIYNSSNGTVEGNNRFQVAWLPDDQHDRYLDHVQTLSLEKHPESSYPQIVFEGNAPAEVEKNRALFDLLTAPSLPKPTRAIQTWLGEPIALRESVSAKFGRQSGSNLLIVGQNDESVLGMMAVAIISLQAQSTNSQGKKQSASDAPFYILDFGATDAPNAEYFSGLSQQLPISVKIGRRRDLDGIMKELSSQVQRRIDSDDSNAPAKYLFFYGLQRARELRQDEEYGLSFNSGEPSSASPTKQFMKILREGPDVGIHTLAWCDTLTNLNRSLDRRAMREFSMRVVFQMTSEDSANLIDTPLASKLGPYRALFYSEEEGPLGKIPPVRTPIGFMVDLGRRMPPKEKYTAIRQTKRFQATVVNASGV